MRELVPGARCLVAASMIVFGSSIVSPAARAQAVPRLDLGGASEARGEAERYLRVLQLSGAVPLVPWTTLPFTARTEDSLVPAGPHPWLARFAAVDSGQRVRWLRPTALAAVNSTFPFQDGLGPVWSGRGATAAIQGGLAAGWGRVRIQVAPIAFLAQNAEFPLAPNGTSDSGQFGDARFPGNIDYPQRFGASSYGRVDPGSSTIAVDLGGASAGISTAPQRWGPAREYPLLLSPGAGGFPHAFVGTSHPVDLWLAHVQARLIAGSLSQSAYSAAPAGRTQRIASAAIVGLTPRGVDGLEIGFARFFESTDRMTLERVLRPLDPRALVGAVGDPSNDVNIANENQMASAFFRWALPDAGAELYGEWYREDFPGDFRKLLLKPDDLSAFTVGFQRVLVASPRQRRLVRIEMVNGELSHQERGQRGFSAPLPPYIHSQVLQGHTHRGLLLGSPEAYGGAGWRAALDDYTERGRVTVGIERALRFDWLPSQTVSPTEVHPDVLYALRFEMLRFAGARDYTLTLVPAIDLNRDLDPGATRLNLYAAVRARGW